MLGQFQSISRAFKTIAFSNSLRRACVMGANMLTFAPVIAATYIEAKSRQILQSANSLDHAG